MERSIGRRFRHMTGDEMTKIAAGEFDLADTATKMGVRMRAPVRDLEFGTWYCEFEIDEPLAVTRKVYGVTSLQALFLAAKTLSVYLYGSDHYKNGELGIYGQFGGDLSIPAPQTMHAWAPYPF